jgi:hypothetical protein
MLTMHYCLPKGENPAEARVILRPEILAKEKPQKPATKLRPALFLFALFMAALLSFSWEAQGAIPEEGRGWSVLKNYQDDASLQGRQERIRRSSTERKRHPRFRKAKTHHRLRAKRPYEKVAARRWAPPAHRHGRHLRHGRYYARKAPGPRVSSDADRCGASGEAAREQTFGRRHTGSESAFEGRGSGLASS